MSFHLSTRRVSYSSQVTQKSLAISAKSFSFSYNYLRRRLASKCILTLGVTLSLCVCVRRISLGGEGNALYPVLSSLVFVCSGADVDKLSLRVRKSL